MSDQTSEKPKHSGPESPTTAREPDFDHDDDNHESSSHPAPERVPTPSHPKRVSFQEVTDEDEAPPAKPPRPVDPQLQAQQTLQEAFPTLDSKVIKAVLLASGGQVEPAFNALLSMSDPDFKVEEQAPPQPPRSTYRQQIPNQYRELSQLEKDELYARQLAEQYQSGSTGFGSQAHGNPPLPKRRTDTGLKANEMYDKEHSFFDDDLPVIKQQLTKGFQDTQKTFNKWITDFKKKIDGDDEDEDDEPPIASSSRQGAQQRQNYGPSQSEQMRGIRKMSQEQSRRSGDRERYDADPRVLSDDFGELELHDGDGIQRQGTRPLANPNLFKPTPAAPQSGPVDEVDALYRQPSPSGGMTTGTIPSGASKTSGKKWQPLTSVAPNPEADDNDPFSLGDSDEEDRKIDLKPEATERLKESARKSVSEGSSGAALNKEDSNLTEAEKTGTKNKEAEELLKAKD